jgi:hypothetical protein
MRWLEPPASSLKRRLRRPQGSLAETWWCCMSDEPTASDPAEELATLQDSLYDLIVTRIAQSRPHDELRRLRRDAHEAAALAEELAELVLRIDDEYPPLA